MGMDGIIREFWGKEQLMYDRYGDVSRFITDPNKLELTDGECVISDDYDIVVDLEECYADFDTVKPVIAEIARHIGEMDNTVQRFNSMKRVKKSGAVPLPSRFGTIRFDYTQSMENDSDSEEKDFPFDLEIVYLQERNMVGLVYWGTRENSEFSVDFEYKDGKYFLRKFGAFENIPDNWEENI